MPKAPKRKTSTARSTKSPGNKSFPYPKATEKETSKSQKSQKNVKSPKDPKDSHLYTDDNPSTTLHGTGFKDADAAEKTIALVSQRSLTYQFQTINTMYNRAKHHPHHTVDIDKAIAVFQTWLKKTYPAAKQAQRDFKPVLSKKIVQALLERLEQTKGVNTEFARFYVELEPRKRLANTLVDPEKPEEEDWDVRRGRALEKLVPEGTEPDEEELWDEDGGPSDKHLKLVAWAWSPVSERKLNGRIGKS